MRFAVSVVGRSGRGSDRRAVLPGNFIRMDDKEVFRIFFENDWNVPGVVTFVYDGDANNLYELTLEPGDMFAHDRQFVYHRTATGAGHLLEVKFERARVPEDGDDEPEPYREQLMLINNDYAADGSAIAYGASGDDASVRAGRQTDPAKDPDAHKWATPRVAAPVYNAGEFDIHPAPPTKSVKRVPLGKARSP